MKAQYHKFTNYFVSMLATLVLFSSCKKGWLDEKSDKTLTVPLTLIEFQGLLDDIQTMTFTYPALGETSSDGHYVSDAAFSGSTRLVNKDAYIWSQTVRHTDVSDWNSSYAKILVDNIVLDGINKINPGSLEQQQWRDIKGQALFHRSRIFFELLQTYAPGYDPTTSTSDLGIVLRLSSDITMPSKRNTVKEVYEQILKDLNEAKNLLPDRPKILTRGSATAANALLSRVYLSMNDYDKAYLAADACLKRYSQLIDYNTILTSATFIGLYNAEVLFHANYTPTVAGLSTWRVDRSLVDLYAIGDLRKTRFYRLNAADGSYSFKGNYESRTDLLFCGLATDEIYLTRAECHARAGRLDEAMKDLNEVIIKRWDKTLSYNTITAANADEALTKILLERKKELIFRGVRWMDLKRLNKDARFAITLTRTVLGTTYTLEPNSYKYAFPIPDDVVQGAGLQQNPGWQR